MAPAAILVLSYRGRRKPSLGYELRVGIRDRDRRDRQV